jgi:dUTP pyrophosphatase
MINLDRIASFEKISFQQYLNDLGCQDHATKKEYEAIKLPKRATTGSAGYDFYSPTSFTLDVGETIKIFTGIRVKMTNGWFLMILPRSGHGFKFRVQLDNTVAIIDSDYYDSENEGHIILKLTNDGKSNKTVSIKAGEGLAQGIFVPFGITIDDEVTAIRNGGFGSTTKQE